MNEAEMLERGQNQIPASEGAADSLAASDLFEHPLLQCQAAEGRDVNHDDKIESQFEVESQVETVTQTVTQIEPRQMHSMRLESGSEEDPVINSATEKPVVGELLEEEAIEEAIAVEAIAPTPTPPASLSSEFTPEVLDVVAEAEIIQPPSLLLDRAESCSQTSEQASKQTQASYAELAEQNQELINWINELELSLSECQVDFKSHLRQFEQQELLLERRTRELITAQEQVVTLSHELEAAQNESQRKRILAETLKAQLSNSQERIAQMERECTLAQRRCAEQSQQLLQAEGLCRDLKSRLNRQQRNTLQFKSALEKSLEMSVSPASFELPDLEVEPIEGPEDFFPRSKPVKPWSQQAEDEFCGETIAEGSTGLETAVEPGSSPTIETVEPVFDPVEAASLTATLQSDSERRAMGQELSSVPVQEAASSSETAARITFVPPIVPTAAISSPAGLAAAAGQSGGPATHETVPGAESSAPESSLSPEAEELHEGNLTLSQQANWPAPLVNPIRPAKKKIDSLAAIELPSFPKTSSAAPS